VTLDAADDEGGSGVARSEYSLDGGPWTAYDGPFTVGSDGSHTLTYRSVDRQDNVEESQTVTFNIDRTAPQLTCSARPDQLWPANRMLVRVSTRVTVMDAGSGAAGFVLSSVTSDEPDSGTSRHDKPGDIADWAATTPDTEGRLRAERADQRRQRTYTITYTGRDQAGNATSCEATVMVERRRSSDDDDDDDDDD
jgi:hypothetical protein